MRCANQHDKYIMHSVEGRCRNTNNKSKMTDAAREERNAYMREYRRKHRDQVQRQNTSYWERKAQQKASEAQKDAKNISEGSDDA